MPNRTKITLSQYMVYVVVRITLFMFSLLPYQMVIKLGRFAGRIYYRIDNKHRNICFRNLEIAFPEKSAEEKELIARGSYENIGEMAGLISKFPSLLRKGKTGDLVRYCGNDGFFKAKKEGMPVLFLTAHLGLWEFLAFAQGTLYGRVNFIVRSINHPLLDKLLNRYRALPGNTPIPKKYAVKKVLSCLAKGEDVGILNDQNTKEKEGIFVDFFGKKAIMNIAFAAMAMRSNAAVFPIFLVPDSERKKRYCIHIFPEIPIQRSGNKEADIKENTKRIAQAIEKAIRMWPDRWLWMHRRWKTRPPDDKEDPYAGL